MYEINIRLERIDYEQTINSLFPRLINDCASEDEPSMVFRLLKKLDDTAMVIAKDLLALISDEDKMELLKYLVNFYNSDLTSLINKLLREYVDDEAEMSGLIARRCEDYPLSLVLCDVNIRLVALAEKLPSGIALLLKPILKLGGGHEKAILDFVQKNKYIWGTLLSKLESKLHQKGFYVYIQDIEISESIPSIDSAHSKVKPSLPRELEDSIIDALSTYLKSHFNP